MSYEKAMRHSIRKSKKQANNHFGFTTIEPNERREIPALGGVWFKDGREEERKLFIEEWREETKRLLLKNPNLVII
jgi:hypothetical protein